MRPKSVIDKSTPQKVFRYSFEASIEEIQLNIRFPCKLSIHWNYGQGSVTSVKPISLEKGVARFQQTLSFSTNVNFNEERQQYVEQRTTLEIFIITENGNSLAGFVTLDLAKIVGTQERKQVFQIERCPDRTANLRMRISYQFQAQKYSRVTHFDTTNSFKTKEKEKQKDSSMNQLSDGKTEQYNRRIDPQSVKNKQLIEREVNMLKARLTDFQGKYKTQKAERQKLSDLLKGKQEVYFTLKTQIKRKEIEIDGMLKSLEEYRAEYQRLKIQNDNLIRTREKLQSILQNIEKSSSQKISRLESENMSLFRKFEKLESEFGRTNKQKDSLFISIRQKNEGNNKQKELFNESTRQLKKQKQQLQRNYKTDKEGYQKVIRELRRNNEETEQELNDLKQKYAVAQKKVGKIEEQRMDQMTKNNLKIVDLEKAKESLTIELMSIKKQIHKKDTHSTQNIKSLQKHLNEERMNNSKLAQSVVDLQNQKKLQIKQLQRNKQSINLLQETKAKLQQQIEHLKYQTNNLNELLAAKNNQLKAFGIRQKQVNDQFKRKQAELQAKNKQIMFEFEVKLRQLKRTEQNKYANATTNSIRKEKDLEDAAVREQKLSMHIETMKQQYKKNEAIWKDKIQTLKGSQSSLKQECLSISKKKDQAEQDFIEKMRQMELQIYSLNESLSEAKDNEFRLLERQDRLRIQKDEIHRMYNELKMNSMKLREQYQRGKDYLQEFERNQTQLNRQLETSQDRYTKIVKELKERILEVEDEKIRLQALLKQRERATNQSVKLLKQQIEQYKNEVFRKELQIKKLQDQHRDASSREKVKLNEMEIELEKFQSDFARMSSISEQKEHQIEQLNLEIKQYRDNIKAITIEKQSLTRNQEEVEVQKAQLKDSIHNYDNELYSKSKEIKDLKVRLQQIELQNKQGQVLRKRNKILTEDLHQITWRLSGSQLSYVPLPEFTSEHEDLMQLKKRLLVIENKINKQQQVIFTTSGNYKRQIEEYLNKIQQNEAEIGRLKTQLHNFKKIEQSHLQQMHSMRIQNQELLYQINTLQTDIITTKSNTSILESKLKDEQQHYKQQQSEFKKQIQKYEILLNSTRVELAEKHERQKKQLSTIIRSLEQKIQTLEQKNFALELDNQKIQEYLKRQDENKKVFARVYELERQNFELVQLQKQFQERSLGMEQKLQWEKNLLEQSNKNMQARMENTINVLQIENNKLSSRNKQLTTILREKEFILEQTQKNFVSLQEQSNLQIIGLKQQKDRITDSQFRLKNELAKVKSELLSVRNNSEQNKDRLLSLEPLARIKTELQAELEQKNERIIQLEDKESKLNQQIFRLKQQLQSLKWDYQRAVSNKQAEIMSIQQQLYTLNSKQNIRMLRQIQFTEKQKLMELQKKNMLKEIQQYKQKFRMLIDNQRNAEVIRNIEQQKHIIIENEKKHGEIIKILEQEIKNLKNQSNMMKKEVA